MFESIIESSSSIITLVFGFLLVVITLALIFSAGFRKDLLAGNETSISLGPLSVQGVVIVGLVTLFSIGALSPVIFEGWKVYSGNAEPSGQCEGIRNELTKCKTAGNGMIARTDIVETIAGLDRDDKISAGIRRLRDEQKGPWGLPGSKEVAVSVPGNIQESLACPNYANKELTLGYDGRTLQTTINGIFWNSRDCEEKWGYGIKLSCADARELTGEDSISCKGNGPNKFEAGVVFK